MFASRTPNDRNVTSGIGRHTGESSGRLTFVRLAVILAALLTASVPSASPARADSDGLVETSRSTFRLLPRQERVGVHVDITLTNRKPSVTRIVPCPGAPSQRCRQRVSYYVDRWGYLLVQSGARDVRITGPGVSARVARRNGPWIGYIVRFPRAEYGQTRRVRVTYQLPAGRPRSTAPTRVTKAYAHFCWHGQPTDRGTVVAVLPGGYETQTRGGGVRARTSRRSTLVQARRPASTARFAVCTDAFDSDKLQRIEAASPSGQHVIVEGWPEDPTWSTSVAEGLPTTLGRLEAIIGEGLPTDGIVIRQVASQALDGYAGEFSLTRGQIRVGESLEDPTLVAHELAHAWFNGASLADLWLIEGYAQWAATVATVQQCAEPGDYPGKGSPQVRRWRFLGPDPSRTDQAVVDYQYAAACTLIAEIASLVGPHRMRELTAAVLSGESAYAARGAMRADDPPVPGWREWLDAVDELGLVPAGHADLELAERLLLEQGIATRRDLRFRSEARAAYHAMLSRHGDATPAIIASYLEEWQFTRALQAIGISEVALAALTKAEMAEADTVALATTRARLAQARSLRGLRATRDEAQVMAAELERGETQA